MQKPELIAIIKVNVSEKVHDLEVFEHSKAKTSAKIFCAKHKLMKSVEDSLVQIIQEVLEDYRQEQRFFSDPRHRDNIGATLYFKGLQMQTKSRQRLDKQRQDQVSRSQAELTFKPTLNKQSLKLLQKKSQVTARPQPVVTVKPQTPEINQFPAVFNSLRKQTASELPPEVLNVLTPLIETPNLAKNQFDAFVKELTEEAKKVLKKYEASVYERQTAHQKKTQEKLQALREEKAIREMSECSFRPALIPRKSKLHLNK